MKKKQNKELRGNKDGAGKKMSKNVNVIKDVREDITSTKEEKNDIKRNN